MEILKIKDGNIWKTIPAIKGDKGEQGDSYVLTSADKAEIADTVYNMIESAEGSDY